MRSHVNVGPYCSNSIRGEEGVKEQVGSEVGSDVLLQKVGTAVKGLGWPERAGAERKIVVGGFRLPRCRYFVISVSYVCIVGWRGSTEGWTARKTKGFAIVVETAKCGLQGGDGRAKGC